MSIILSISNRELKFIKDCILRINLLEGFYTEEKEIIINLNNKVKKQRIRQEVIALKRYRKREEKAP